MNPDFKYPILLSYYRSLLTEKQNLYLTLYYEQNATISEIAEELCVSKESVFDLIKRVQKKLDQYEKKLQLLEKSNKIATVLTKNNVDEEIIEEIMELI